MRITRSTSLDEQNEQISQNSDSFIPTNDIYIKNKSSKVGLRQNDSTLMNKIKAVNDSNDGTDGYTILIITREVFFSTCIGF
jgi:hypothetical protein